MATARAGDGEILSAQMMDDPAHKLSPLHAMSSDNAQTRPPRDSYRAPMGPRDTYKHSHAAGSADNTFDKALLPQSIAYINGLVIGGGLPDHHPTYVETSTLNRAPTSVADDSSQAVVSRDPTRIETLTPAKGRDDASNRSQLDAGRVGQVLASLMPMASASPQEPKPEFRLRIVQQPKAARACGNGDRDRRTIDPPPILSIEAIGSLLSPVQIDQYLRKNPGIVHCNLIDAETHQDALQTPVINETRPSRRLIGTVVSHVCQPSNTTVLPPALAVFPDLSVRTQGHFRLNFRFAILPKPEPGAKAIPHAFATSDAFEVYNAKDFPGMQASTSLIEELRRQGFNVPIRKGYPPHRAENGDEFSTSATLQSNAEIGGLEGPQSRR